MTLAKMRIFPFSVFKKIPFRSFRQSLPKKYGTTQTDVKESKIIGDPSLVEICSSWKHDKEVELRDAFMRDMQVLPDFISEQEEATLLAELEPFLKRMRYEFDHWDNAIQGFRETERVSWRPENEEVLRRVRALAFSHHESLPHAHVLDLAATGFIKPHVDAVRFCGDVIAGLCLVSSAVMRLQYVGDTVGAVVGDMAGDVAEDTAGDTRGLTEGEHSDRVAHALLQRRALYIMRGVARYQFSHAVLGGEHSVWRGVNVPRARRVAVICRSQPERH